MSEETQENEAEYSDEAKEACKRAHELVEADERGEPQTAGPDGKPESLGILKVLIGVGVIKKLWK